MCTPGAPGCAKKPQKITWQSPNGNGVTDTFAYPAAGTHDVRATSDSGLGVTVTVSAGPCSGTGVSNATTNATITLGPKPAPLVVAHCTLTATQAGNDEFLPADPQDAFLNLQGDLTPAPGEYVPVTPKRVLETRATFAGCAANCQTDNWKGKPRPAAGDVVHLQIAGFAADTPVATDASAVVVNVTAVDPAGPGFVTVWDCDDARPIASSVNLQARSDSLDAVPNAVIAKLSSSGEICIYSKQATDLVVDIAGWFPKFSTFNSFSPKRVLETRNEPQINYSGASPAPGGTVITVPLVDAAGATVVPAGSKAVAINVTALNAAATGSLTVWDCNGAAPTTANLTLIANSTIPNLVLASLDTTAATSKVCLVASSSADLVVDVFGFFPAIARYTALSGGAKRLLDTTTGAKPGADAAIAFDVKGVGGIGADATAVVLSVTGRDAGFPGFVIVWPDPTGVCSAASKPNASNVNLVAGSTTTNLVIAKLAASSSKLCVFTQAPANLVIDAFGFFTGTVQAA